MVEEVAAGVSAALGYDANGNLLSRETATDAVFYEWDFDDRLSAIDTDGDGRADAEYKYDYEGIRTSQVVDGEETRYLVDKLRAIPQVVEEYTPGGVIKVSYVYGKNLISQEREGVPTYYHVDGLGSTRALTDAAGNVTARYLYDAFGRHIGQLGSTDNIYLFAGEQRDAVSGLDFLRARYMDRSTGRFISRDTFPGRNTHPVSHHRYLYADANPVVNTDPTGNFTLLGINVGMSIQGILRSMSQTRYVRYYQKANEFADALSLFGTAYNGAFTAIGFYSGFLAQLQAAGQNPWWAPTGVSQQLGSVNIPLDDEFKIVLAATISPPSGGAVSGGIQVGAEISVDGGSGNSKWAGAIKSDTTINYRKDHQGIQIVGLGLGGAFEVTIFERPPQDSTLVDIGFVKAGFLATGTVEIGGGIDLDFASPNNSGGKATFEFAMKFLSGKFGVAGGTDGTSPYIKLGASKIAF